MTRLLHPALVHFPIALWMTAALFDVLYLWRRDPFFATGARYLIGLGLLGAGVAMAAGWRDLLTQEALGIGTALRIQHQIHSLLAYGTTVLYAAVFLGRWRRPAPGWTILLSLVGAGAVVVTAYFGGELRRVM